MGQAAECGACVFGEIWNLLHPEASAARGQTWSAAIREYTDSGGGGQPASGFQRTAAHGRSPENDAGVTGRAQQASRVEDALRARHETLGTMDDGADGLGLKPGDIGRYNQHRDAAGRLNGRGNRFRNSRPQTFRTFNGPNGVRNSSRELSDIGTERRIILQVSSAVLADDAHDGGPRFPCVVKIRKGVPKAGAQMQQRRSR